MSVTAKSPTTATVGFTLSDPNLWLGGPPLDKFAYLRESAPISWHEEPPSEWFPEGGRGYWSLVRQSDIQAASKDQDTFTSGEGTELVDMPLEMTRAYGGMLNMPGPEHAKHRAIVSRIFTPRTLADLTPRIREYARTRILRARELGTFDFVKDLVGDFPAQIVCDLMGVPLEDRDELIALTGEALSGNGTAHSYESMLKIIAYSTDLAERTSEEPDEQASVLKKLIDAEVDGEKLTHEEVGVFMSLILTAGIETTATSIAQGFRGLCMYPNERAKWQKDFDARAQSVVEEIVRWVTPVMHFRRTATRDVEMHGHTIRKGDKVVLWFIAGNRDESVIHDADTLDFDRKFAPHVAFGGGGPHFCLGAMLARLEITIFFRELFELMPEATVVGAPTQLHSNFVNGISELPSAAHPLTS